MKLHLSQNQIDEANSEIINNIATILHYENVPRNELHTYLSISVLLALINSHINQDFHINLMSRDKFSWLVESYLYRTEDKELVDALWKSVQYCYDEKARKKEIEEREKQWRKNESELVHVKNTGRGI